MEGTAVILFSLAELEELEALLKEFPDAVKKGTIKGIILKIQEGIEHAKSMQKFYDEVGCNLDFNAIQKELYARLYES